MPENTDGVQHPTHVKHRHAVGDHTVAKSTDGGGTHQIEADKAAHRLSRHAWGSMEDDKRKLGPKHAAPGGVIQASEKAAAPAATGAPNDAAAAARKVKAGEQHFQPMADNRFNYQQPVQKLIEAGLFKGGGQSLDKLNNQQQPDAAAARDTTRNPVKNIEVRYSDTPVPAGQTQNKPDFRVKQDGTVEVLRNPDQTRSANVTVELERPAGVDGRQAPPEAQQKATNQLVDYLSSRYMKQKLAADGSIQRDGEITDNQGLVGEQTRQAERTRPSAVDRLPQPVQDQVHRINRGGGRGQYTPDQASEDFAPRTVPRQADETDKIAAIKDISSGFLTRGDKDPYHSVQKWPDQGNRVGRYGIGANHYRDWLKSMSHDEIQKLIDEGKLPPGALDLQQSLKEGKDGSELTGAGKDLKDFLDKMQNGQGTTNQEIDKFMPKELQERIGTDMIKSYAVATADKDKDGKPAMVNVGKLALSMVLGHAVTDKEASSPQNKAIVDAAYKQYALAVQHEQNPGGNINMSDAGNKIAAVARADVGGILWGRHASVVQGGRLGCASSVTKVLQQAGVTNVDDAGVQSMSDKLKRQGWQAYSFNQRRPGDVIIAQGGASSGHTGIVGQDVNVTYDNHSGNGRWSTDAASHWGAWRRVYVLRAPGTNTA